MTRSVWHIDQTAKSRADFCVVGAGLLGAATAFWLGRLQPDAEVVLLDRRWPAYGASGRNAGFLLQGAVTDYVTDIKLYGAEKALRLRQLTHENRDRLLAELDPEAFRFRATGSLTVAGDPAEESRLRESETLMREGGFPARFLEAEEVNRRLESRGYLGGLFAESGGMLDPVALVTQLVARSGARLWTGAEVARLEGGLVVGDGFEIEAGKTVVCGGPWTPALVPEARAWVSPIRAQMLAFSPGELRIPMPVYSHEGYYYIRSDEDGRVLLGGARHLHREAEVGFEDRVTPRLQSDLEAYGLQHFPGLAGRSVERRWSGTMGFSPDGLPFVGALDNGRLVATGFTGHGLAYGFRCGLMLANLALGRRDEFADLFDPHRPVSPGS